MAEEKDVQTLRQRTGEKTKPKTANPKLALKDGHVCIHIYNLSNEDDIFSLYLFTHINFLDVHIYIYT